jgi:hypothetical protein
VKLEFQKSVNVLKLNGQALHTEGNKQGQIERERLLPALVQQGVVFRVVLVEIAPKSIEAVSVVPSLKKYRSRNQAAQSAVAVYERMNGSEEEVR